MKKLVAPLALAILGTAALAATPAQPDASGTRYWLHPKLGMVKIDNRTHAMVIPGKTQPREGVKAAPAAATR